MSMAIKVARIQTQGSGRVMPGIGDPGFFGDVFGRIGAGVKGALTGGVSGAIQGLLGGGGRTVSNGTIISGSGFQQAPQGPPPKFPGKIGPIDLDILGFGQKGASISFFNGGGGGVNGNGNGTILACATGHHPNKSDYFLKNGTFIQKGSRCVKNRRRNPLNARAADRAISRIESAKRATKRLSRITIRKTCP